MYVLGGANKYKYIKCVEKWDPDCDKWSIVNVNLDNSISRLSVVCIDKINEILIQVGGNIN